MNYFGGTISEAVNLSKTKNAIFVVYVEGAGANLTAILDDQKIRSQLESSKFVTIKIKSNSEEYMQFAQIYKLVPLPSIFFIGTNGAPIDIVTETTKTADELELKINNVLQKSGVKQTASSTASFLANETAAAASSSSSSTSNVPPTAAEAEVVCEDGVCQLKPKESETAENSAAKLDAEEKLRRAKEIIEKKKNEKEAEDARLAKERELQRRRAGQDIQSFKERQEELNMIQMKEERKKAKLDEQAARKRILEQIAQDRAENAQRFGQPIASQTQSSLNEIKMEKPLIIKSDLSTARIQFKKPDGETETHTFNSTDTFQVLRTYVEDCVLAGTVIRDFTLATSFPRREFTEDDNIKTMKDLDLAPTSVILIIPLERLNTNNIANSINRIGMFDIFTNSFWALASPVLALYHYVLSLMWNRQNAAPGSDVGAQKRAGEEKMSDNDNAKRRNLNFMNTKTKEDQSNPGPSGASTYRRSTAGSSNIHRLRENQDSDDDNNTWNGNSTQQQ